MAAPRLINTPLLGSPAPPESPRRKTWCLEMVAKVHKHSDTLHTRQRHSPGPQHLGGPHHGTGGHAHQGKGGQHLHGQGNVGRGRKGERQPAPRRSAVLWRAWGRCRGAIMATNTITVDNKNTLGNVALAFQLVWNISIIIFHTIDLIKYNY